MERSPEDILASEGTQGLVNAISAAKDYTQSLETALDKVIENNNIADSVKEEVGRGFTRPILHTDYFNAVGPLDYEFSLGCIAHWDHWLDNLKLAEGELSFTIAKDCYLYFSSGIDEDGRYIDDYPITVYPNGDETYCVKDGVGDVTIVSSITKEQLTLKVKAALELGLEFEPRAILPITEEVKSHATVS